MSICLFDDLTIIIRPDTVNAIRVSIVYTVNHLLSERIKDEDVLLLTSCSQYLAIFIELKVEDSSWTSDRYLMKGEHSITIL